MRSAQNARCVENSPKGNCQIGIKGHDEAVIYMLPADSFMGQKTRYAGKDLLAEYDYKPFSSEFTIYSSPKASTKDLVHQWQ
jgi:hypothetical protein